MSYWRVFYHIVWTTKKRGPIISPLIEPFIFKTLGVRCREEGGHALAINGMPDHIHLVTIIPPKVAVSEFIGRLKGSSSRFVSLEYDIPFEWQPGDGLFSLSERLVQRAVEYVRQQKTHHLQGTIIRRLEHTSDDDDGPTVFPRTD